MEKFNFENENILKEEASEFKQKLDSFVYEAINNKDRQQLRHLIVGGYINREYFNELLQKYSNYNTEYQEVMRVDEMIDLLIPQEKSEELQLVSPNFIYIDKVILPTEENNNRHVVGGSDTYNEINEIPRVELLIDLLNKNGISDYECITGQNDQEMMRTLSYVMFVLKDIKKMIFVCNEEGNATYVIYGECDNAEKYFSLNKNEIQNLILNNFGKKIRWSGEEKWKKEILEELKNIANIDVSKINKNEFLEIINKKKEDPYSFEDAGIVVRALGIKTKEEYQQRHKEDMRLPGSPNKTYKENWLGWPHFLRGEKKEFYTYEEAKEIVKNLGILTYTEYRNRHNEDSRLPSVPMKIYKDQWISWGEFLRDERKEEFYSFEEAKIAVRKMKIKSFSEYRNRYKEDPKLPSNPHNTYNEFKSFNDFLGKV
ncbi:MAG TPA: integrase repeat-containing protein [bacterium]|nr:integrase repeat-containing protein [bacterium]